MFNESKEKQNLLKMADPMKDYSQNEQSLSTILVVDDTEASLQTLTEMLMTFGFTVKTANGGVAAVAITPQLMPDLILLDIKMPDLDGFAVCKQLKGNALTKDIPIIFISGLHEVFDKVCAFQVGAVDYITKPFAIEEILARIDTHLRVRRLHEDLVAKNQVLTDALAQLQETQQQLVESEKFAALGTMVAGIAHEINTPLGIGVTAASTLNDETTVLQQAYRDGRLARSVLDHYLHVANHSSQLILSNLQRAADLLQSLKQVSADQIHLERRRFALRDYLHEILRNLEPSLKQAKLHIQVEESDEVVVESYPGAFSQIITNLVMNSIHHAYPTDEAGTLYFSWQRSGRQITFRYADDGCGIPNEYRNRIFDPFFTTAQGSGGTGLGLHIVYNLATNKLGGRIRYRSIKGIGTAFILDFPVNVPDRCTNAKES